MAKKADEIVQEVLADFGRVSGARTNWEGHWDEIARRVWPAMAGSFYGNGIGQTPGAKRTEELFDSTPPIALSRFSAVVDSLLTPQNSKYQRLVASLPELMKDRSVRLYFEQATDVLFKYRRAPKAGFIGQNSAVYQQLGAFGTGPMFVDTLRDEPGLRYKAVPLGEIFFAENHQGIIDRAWRRFAMTARQIKQRWPGVALPDQIAKSTNPNQLFFIIHCVAPREEVDYSRFDYRGMKYASYFISETGKILLEESGYRTFPFAVSRYTVGPGEVYGRSPAMLALPAIKTLNEEKKTLLKQGHRALDPVLLLHDDGVLDGFSMKPGALNFGGVSADGKPLVHTLPTGDIVVGKELMDDERVAINDAFLVSLFQILVETPEMTATEVMERAKEKGILLTPTVGRQYTEYMAPMTDRELDLLAAQNLLPPMPPILKEAQGEYTVEFDSPLTRAQRAEEAAGLMRSVEATLNIVNVTQDPTPLDHYNWDTIIPELNEINGVPLRWMNGPVKVAAIRDSRAEQQQAQQAVQAMPGVAALTKAQATVGKQRANAAA